MESVLSLSRDAFERTIPELMLVLVLVLGLGLAIVIVLDTRQQLGQRRGRHDSWPSITKNSTSLAHARKPAIESGPQHENEHDDDCESEHEHEHEHESWIAGLPKRDR
jgi:hypothetical protein